jgi:hypothetical protein
VDIERGEIELDVDFLGPGLESAPGSRSASERRNAS